MFSFIVETEVCNFTDDNTLNANAFLWMLSYQPSKRVRKCSGSETIIWPQILQSFKQFFLLYQMTEKLLSISLVLLTSSYVIRTFKLHVQSLYKSTSQKLKAHFRNRPFINTKCTKRLFEAYILSTFNLYTTYMLVVSCMMTF